MPVTLTKRPSTLGVIATLQRIKDHTEHIDRTNGPTVELNADPIGAVGALDMALVEMTRPFPAAARPVRSYVGRHRPARFPMPPNANQVGLHRLGWGPDMLVCRCTDGQHLTAVRLGS